MSMFGVRRLARATLLTCVAATTSGLALSGPAAAQDADCETRLMLVPIENTEVPSGWEWEMLILGYPLGLPGWVGGVATTDEDDYASASLTLACSPDASLALSRSSQVQVSLMGAEVIELEPIGDRSFAWREADGGVAIQWLHGDMLGTITTIDEGSLDALTELALALEAVIP
jgi:hypothetical protein